MKTIFFGLITAIIFIHFSCTKTTNSNLNNEEAIIDTIDSRATETLDTITAFRSFLSKYRILKLPIIIKGCYFNSEKENLPQVNQELDTIFFKNGSNNYCYGMLDDTLNYFALITMAPADCFGPILSTFTKEGRLISKESINIGYCGSGCGYSCEEFMKIYSNNQIYTSDSVSYYVCDSLGDEIPNSSGEYVIFKEGKIDLQGNILLSDEQKIEIKSK